MAIERTTFLYELLIRFGPDGYQGSHVIDLERVADGDEIIAERELPARPVTEIEIGPIIGDENARLVEATSTALAGKAQAEADRAAAIEERDAALAEAEALRARLASPQA